MQNKDAMTDLVEHVQGTTPTPAPQQSAPERQVVSQAGETITLGQQSEQK